MIELRLLDRAGNEVAPLPDLSAFTLSPVFCDQGAIEFSYPADGVNWAQLKNKDEIEVAVYIDGARQAQLDSILQDVDGDSIKEAGVWKFSGFQNIGRLNEAKVYPPNWPTFDPKLTKFQFTAATAGNIMKSLINAAQARGTLSDITHASWNTTTDSNGVAWNKQINIEYAPGVGYLDVLRGLYNSAMVEFVMVGKDLRLYNAGAFGVDRTIPSYRYYRFSPTAVRGPSLDGTQISEFAFLNGSTRLTGATVTSPNTPKLGEEASKAGDGSTATKWYTVDHPPTPTALLFDFGAPVAADGYQWATANDMPSRDPISWVVEGSNDNAAWVTLDAQNNYPVTTTRLTYLPNFSLTEPNPLVFRKGRDMSDSTHKVSSRAVSTAMLGAGEEGTYLEKTNPTEIANRRRIEGFISNGNVRDNGTLQAFTESSLAQVVHAKLEKSHGLEFVDAATPRPIKNFNIGDWAFSDSGNGLERYRVKQWVLKLDDKGVLSGSVQLNDLFDEQNAMLTHRIAGIVGGSTITGASTATERIPADLTNSLGPAVPTGLTATSAPFTDDHGVTWAQVTASWAQVTTNSDGTVITDLAGYQISWRYLSMGASAPGHVVEAPGTGTSVTWSPVGANAQISIKVRAYDKSNNYGAWSAEYTLTTQDDTTPPEQPSTPVADNYAGLLRLTYDGKTASGAAWAPDVQTFQVHASTTNNFTPVKSDPLTWVDTLTAAGQTFLDPGYGQTRYFKILAIDRSGNASVPSAQSAAVTTQQLLSADIFDGAVGTAKLADAAITTAKIANLAVNDAQIGSVNVGKITAGVMSATLTVSGRIATALTGKRVEMNSVGFQGFDAAGNNTISLDGVSNLLMGTLKTALTGRRVEISAVGTVAEINFYGPAGQLGQVRGFTTDTNEWSSEAITMRYPITGTAAAWNQISVGSNEQAYIGTGYIGLYVGGDGTGLKGFQVRWEPTRGSATAALGSGTQRFIIDANGTFIYAPDGGMIAQFANTGGTDYWTRLRAQSTAGNFGGTVDFIFYRTDTSPALRMFASNMVSAGHFFFDGSANWFSFVNGAANAYTEVRASNFNTTSDEGAKKSIRKFTGAREKIANLEPHTYEMRGIKGGRRRLGFLSHSAPDEVRVIPHKDDPIQHEAIDLYGLTTLGIEYAKEIDRDLAKLSEQVAELKELVSK